MRIKAGTIDIPLVGSAIGKCQSGLITFGKTNWPDNTGYTIQANIDTILNSMGKKTVYEKSLMTNSAVQFKKNQNHRSNAMKIMAATFNGVAPSRDDYEDDAEYQKAYANYTQLLKDTKALFAGFNNQRYSVEVAVILALTLLKRRTTTICSLAVRFLSAEHIHLIRLCTHYNLRCTCIF